MTANASDWQDDEMNQRASGFDNWQVGAYLNRATRGAGGIGGFVSEDDSANQSVYVWHRSSGWYVQAQNFNSLNKKDDFGDGQSYAIGNFYVFDDDMSMLVGYRYDNLWDVGWGLNTDVHNVYGGIYLPRIFADDYSDGLRFYMEAQGSKPDNENIMKMKGGFMARVGVKTKIFILPNGLEIDMSVGGNDGVFGRNSDLLGFGMVRFSSQYNIVGNLTVKPYILGIKQDRPDPEENEDDFVGGIQIGFHL